MARPVSLAAGVWRLPTVGSNLVNSFVFEEPDRSLTLVDVGYKGNGARRIVAGLAALGRQPEEVRRILLTHAHTDHGGAAARVMARTGASLAAHVDEARYPREGRTPSIDRSTVLGRVFDRIRPGLERVEVASTFADGEVLDVAGGLRVLHTPGHSPGHCSFLHEPSGVLITGDSLFNFLDRMSWSFAAFCSDWRLSRDTADRLGEVEYEIAAFTHGPELRQNARERVREFLRRKSKAR